MRIRFKNIRYKCFIGETTGWRKMHEEEHHDLYIIIKYYWAD